MDPDAALNELLSECQNVMVDTTGMYSSTNSQLAERVLALHEWIVNGGFLPSVWADAQTRAWDDAIGTLPGESIVENVRKARE